MMMMMMMMMILLLLLLLLLLFQVHEPNDETLGNTEKVQEFILKELQTSYIAQIFEKIQVIMPTK
jgi:uncharacterized membrane protein